MMIPTLKKVVLNCFKFPNFYVFLKFDPIKAYPNKIYEFIIIKIFRDGGDNGL